MNDKRYLVISGVIFGLAAVGQLVRLILQMPVHIGTLNVPVWPSAIGFLVALAMCLWAIRLARR